MGQYGVPVFIVLSGFVLTLPVCRSPDLSLRGGSIQFLRRRARRILPPYYAALLLFLVLILVIPGLNHRSGTDWDSKIPITADAVLTHVLLVDNLGSTSFRIDGPMWSVATEFQLYLVLPLLIIPMWRRFGIEITAGVCLIIGLVLQHEVASAYPIFLGLFAFGAVAAQRVTNTNAAPSRLWKHAAVVLFTIGAALQFSPNDEGLRHAWAVETVLGAAIACGLVHLVASNNSQLESRTLALLKHRWLVSLGLFSYSIYLIHSPLIGWANLATRHIAMPGLVRFGVLVLVVVPMAVGISWIFFRLIERHFLSGHQAAVEQPVEIRAGA